MVIGHTALSNAFSVVTRPVLAADNITSSPPYGVSHGDSAQEHAQSTPSTFAPVESLAETNQATNQKLPRAQYEQSSSVPSDGSHVSEDVNDTDEYSKEEQELNAKAEKQVLEQEQEEISQLAARDREVRAHEQAHAAVGGQYAGSPTYSFQRGPDGVRYAVGGEVSIDTSKAATPEETIRKAQVVRRAALAPADPSPQDRRVAAEASQIQAEALHELRIKQVEEQKQKESTDDINENHNDVSVDSIQSELLDEVGLPGEQEANNTGFTNTSNSIIGSRTYESIAGLGISFQDKHSLLDQII